MVSLSELYRNIQELPPSLHGQVNDFVEFLKEKYATQPAEEEFWAFIAMIDPDGSSAEEELSVVTDQLTKEGMDAIYDFQDTLALKLQQLDTPEFWEAGGGSSDGFLYVRCYVVAKGEDYYGRVISGDEPFPEHFSVFEELLYVAENAYEKCYGTDLERLPVVSYESRTNEAAWKSQKSAV